MNRQLTPPCSTRWKFAGATVLASAVVLLSIGCAKPTTGHVRGTVYQGDGKPLPGGTVVFYPTEGRTRHSSVEINDDGTYDMLQAPAGKVKIAVTNLYLKEGTPPPVGMGGNAKGPSTSSAPPAMQAKMKGAGGPPKGITMGPPKGTPGAEKALAAQQNTGARPDKYVKINEKYSNPETSELTFEVKPGDQTFDIKLK